MAGYFYNDGRVREIAERAELESALDAGPALLLCGPGERRRLGAESALRLRVLAEGARRDALLLVERDPPR
jgi:hypothetical protein